MSHLVQSPSSTARDAAPPVVLALDAIPTAPDATIAGELDMAFSTHLSVVVNAQLEFAGGQPPMEVALVVPRTHCPHGQPLLSALMDAARIAIDRNTHAWQADGRRPSRLTLLVNQRRYALYAFPV